MIATGSLKSYSSAMLIARILRFLSIVAVLFAPLSMAGGHAAMAIPALEQAQMHHARRDIPAGHCADMDQTRSGDQEAPAGAGIDCMIACSAFPVAEFTVASHPAVHGVMQVGRLASLHPGLHPESEPPPPRFS